MGRRLNITKAGRVRGTEVRGVGLRRFSAGAAAVLAAVLVLSGPLRAQTVAPKGFGRLSLQPGESVSSVTSRDAFGKPCADAQGASRAHLSNPNVFDHVVSVVNRCLKPIRLRICYFRSDRCFDIDVAGTKRRDLVLGISPGIRDFRYSYKEIR